MNGHSHQFASSLDDRTSPMGKNSEWDWGADDDRSGPPYCCYIALSTYRIALALAILLSMCVRLPGTDDAVSSAIGFVLVALTIPAPLILGLAIAGILRRERPLHLIALAIADSLPGLFIMAMLAKTFFAHSA